MITLSEIMLLERQWIALRLTLESFDGKCKSHVIAVIAHVSQGYYFVMSIIEKSIYRY